MLTFKASPTVPALRIPGFTTTWWWTSESYWMSKRVQTSANKRIRNNTYRLDDGVAGSMGHVEVKQVCNAEGYKADYSYLVVFVLLSSMSLSVSCGVVFSGTVGVVFAGTVGVVFY